MEVHYKCPFIPGKSLASQNTLEGVICFYGKCLKSLNPTCSRLSSSQLPVPGPEPRPGTSGPQEESGFSPQNPMFVLNHNKNQGEFSLKTQGLGALPAFPEIISSKVATAVNRYGAILEDSCLHSYKLRCVLENCPGKQSALISRHQDATLRAPSEISGVREFASALCYRVNCVPPTHIHMLKS